MALDDQGFVTVEEDLGDDLEEVKEPEWVWPLPLYNGRSPVISDGFFSEATDAHRRHPGVDCTYRRLPSEPIGLPQGTKGYFTPAQTTVMAALDGLVTVSRLDPKGGRITLDHGDGVRTNYMHLAQRFVSKGQNVKAGQPIGVVGHNPQASGYAFDHLHFEILENDTHVDPEPRMKEWLKLATPIIEVATVLLVAAAFGAAYYFRGA